MTLEQQYESLTLDDIRHWITEQQEEHLHLEFKELRDPTLKKEDRTRFAKGLSAFANADGGLMVWGVSTKKVDGSDRACGITPVADARALAALLSELEGEYVLPRLDGVRHRALVAEGTTEGVVLTLIPRSEYPPHMAKAGVDRYYKRSGSHTYPMEHFDLEDMFGRRPRPQLSVRIDREVFFDSASPPRAKAYLRLAVVCVNKGRGYAQFPSVLITCPEGRPVKDYLGNTVHSSPKTPVAAPSGWWLRWNYGADVVVYPDDERELTYVSLYYSNDSAVIEDVVFKTRLIAANSLAVDEVQVIPGEEIRRELARVFDANDVFYQS